MKVCFSHKTALDLLRFWSQSQGIPLGVFHSLRIGEARHLPFRSLRASRSLASCATREIDVARCIDFACEEAAGTQFGQFLAQLFRSEAVHVLIPRLPGKHHTQRVAFHQVANALPKASLLEIAPGILCVSPEYLFVQFAENFGLGELIALGYELCGCYPIEGRDGLVRRPLATPQRLVSFAERATRFRGVCRARVAAKYVHAKSASAMESEMSALVLSPRKWGGYGLPSARLNQIVELSPAAARIARSSRLAVDLLWREHGVALEYDGRASHEGSSQMARDSRRRDALAASGIDLSTVTSQQFSSINEFEAIVSHVERKIGRKPQPITPQFREENMRLRQQLRSFHLNWLD